jgi:hypothetical protein
VARFEISDVQTLFWLGNRVGAVSKRFCQPYWTLDTGWAVDFFLGEIIVTELKELLKAVGIMDHGNR